jgi:hypothetical protein
MVMRLATPLSSTDAAKPIPINIDDYYPSNKQALKAYGFGLTEDNLVSDYLREAEVTYISNDECWGRGINFNNVVKSDEVMCTDPYGDRTATCLGDSGGPLTDASGSTLIGVISFGSGCEADHIPDGHVRLSQVHDWIEKQICDLSANPPPICGLNTEPCDPRTVEVVIDFTHDFYPEHTTFAVRSKDTLETVYAGPEYIPTRNGKYKESVFLLPGEYTFEVYDVEGNGLVSSTGDGFWKVSALYDGFTETELANGGASFKNQQVTKFDVSEGTTSNSKCTGNNDAEKISPNIDNVADVSDIVPDDKTNKCLNEKDAEMAVGKIFGTTCECLTSTASATVEVSCVDGDGKSCAHNYQTCTTSSDCCSGRRCLSGKCRSSSPITTGRDNKRIGDKVIGGAAARSSRGGNLRGR